jgi:trk system potassium uptake protein TrkH
MPQFSGSVNRYSGRASLAWYAALLVLGTGSLAFLPACWGDPEKPISVLDALFTTTSACCVTGLSVRSTAHDFTYLGQGIILLLIQLGGIGIMTVTTFIVVQFDRRGSLRQRKAIVDTLGAGGRGDIKRLLRNVLLMTFGCEALGASILASYNLWHYERYAALGVWNGHGEALWHAVFNSVSAFNNAGFALHDLNLVPMADSWVVNLTVCWLIVTGGLGVPVVSDLWRNRKKPWKEILPDLQLHSKLMLIGTAVLIVGGLGSFLTLEWDGVLRGDPLDQKVVKSLFHSVTCRTAGFNTTDVGKLTDATLFISILLMAIGAGPCSTAGGFKVTTASILALRAWATFQGYSRVNVFRRTLPESAIDRAVATAMLFIVISIVALTALLIVEQSYGGLGRRDNLFLEAAFEVVSALGTVGLSTGITPQLSDPGKVIIIMLMLLGRLGPITTFVALSHSERREPVEFLNEEPLVG